MRTPSLVLALAVALLGGCGGDDYDPNGEGVRRYGALEEDSQDRYSGTSLSVGAAQRATPTAATGTRPTRRRPTRPRRSKAGKYKPSPDGVENGGTITGTVRLTSRPTLWDVQITKDRQACGHDSHKTERVVFDEQSGDKPTLANCLVFLDKLEPETGKDWSGDMAQKKRVAVIDQKGCVYVPHVSAIRGRTQLRVLNSDTAEHNIHGYRKSMSDTAFNFLTPAKSEASPGDAFLKKPGKYILKCDIHPWMNAYVHVMNTPYFAVTKKDGKFELRDVPPGEYELLYWHEGMSETPQMGGGGAITSYSYGPDVEGMKKVTVQGGDTVTVDIEIAAPGG